MPYPFITTTTACAMLLLQMALAAAVSRSRGKHRSPIGDSGNAGLQRAVRRHGNLSENAAIFLVGFLLLEWSQRTPHLLAAMCVAFLVLRLAHAVGLSMRDTNNVFRVAGGGGTYLLGFALGGTLIRIGLAGVAP